MQNTNEAKGQTDSFDLVEPFWALLLLVGLFSVNIPFAPMLGYRWTVELALAVFLFAAILPSLRRERTFDHRSISLREHRFIHLPIILFIIWSFLSVIWASSWRGVLHHSLLWSCYLLFFLVIRNALRRDEAKRQMLKIIGAILLAVSLACVIEYLNQGWLATKVFNERYYSYAEVIVTLLPVLIACCVGADAKWSRPAYLVSAFSWAAVFATTSRAMLISGLIGLAIFVLFSLMVHREFTNSKRWIAVFASLVVVGFLFLVPFSSQDHPTVLQRMSGTEEYSVRSAESRLLLWGLAFKGFQSQPLTGIGADNYFTRYKDLREDLAAQDADNAVFAANEDLIPERAHNEYLQILAELGIVGATLFAWLLVGVAYLFWLAHKHKASLLTIGALSGMVAFLVASTASSYSFRFPGNGICFFFLLAIGVSELFGSGDEVTEVRPQTIYRFVPIVGVAVSVAMIAFCLVRANSIRHMTNAINAEDEAVRTADIESAISIDPTEPMFRFLYGQWLEQSGDNEGAIREMRIAIDNGLADSTSFFRLAAVEMKAGRRDAAESTLNEALRVYPRSIFLRTAYSTFLNRKGDPVAAEVELASALRIDEKQARSWELAHDKGLERLVQTARVDGSYVSPFDLKPASAPLALANLQRSRNDK